MTSPVKTPTRNYRKQTICEQTFCKITNVAFNYFKRILQKLQGNKPCGLCLTLPRGHAPRTTGWNYNNNNNNNNNASCSFALKKALFVKPLLTKCSCWTAVSGLVPLNCIYVNGGDGSRDWTFTVGVIICTESNNYRDSNPWLITETTVKPNKINRN
jgi:hypothetical protein